MNISEIDKKLLNMLQQGDMCVPRVTAIAHKLKIPTSTVHEKIKRLKEEGVLKGFYGVVDGKKIEQDFIVFLIGKIQLSHLQEDENYFEKVGKIISEIPFVEDLYFVSGEWGVICKTRFKDRKEYFENSKKIVKYFDVHGWGAIATKELKDSPSFEIR
ncbi:MAG TPA: Lrp/AsnC family transcriptional regulator [Candidatus Woesearchaeota archaeon]|nr:Lrp/AsnC family transcriptional regulator [Candidatus Woesearchaeota archaeon]